VAASLCSQASLPAVGLCNVKLLHPALLHSIQRCHFDSPNDTQLQVLHIHQMERPQWLRLWSHSSGCHSKTVQHISHLSYSSISTHPFSSNRWEGPSLWSPTITTSSTHPITHGSLAGQYRLTSQIKFDKRWQGTITQYLVCHTQPRRPSETIWSPHSNSVGHSVSQCNPPTSTLTLKFSYSSLFAM
jgi:hypothetical protein